MLQISITDNLNQLVPPGVLATRSPQPGGVVSALLGVAGDHALHQAAVRRVAPLTLPIVDPLHPSRLVVVEEHVVAHVQFVITKNESPVKITNLNVDRIFLPCRVTCSDLSNKLVELLSMLAHLEYQITPQICFLTMYLPGEILRYMNGASF